MGEDKRSSPMARERRYLSRMLTLLKLIQSIIKTLHSDGTPGQVAAGIALGSALGLTPLMNVHNLVIFSLIVHAQRLVRRRHAGLDAVRAAGLPARSGVPRDRASAARGAVAPGHCGPTGTTRRSLPYTNFNNTVVLGSVVGWLVLAVPIYFAAKCGITRYRATIGERVRQSKFYKAITASQVYNWYRLFRPS